MAKICNKCGRKLSLLEGKNYIENDKELLLCDNCFEKIEYDKIKSQGQLVSDKKSELFDTHKGKLEKDVESRMTKDLIINIKKCPNKEGLLEVTGIEEILKLTKGYVRQYVWKYEDEKTVVYISPPFYYEMKKK
jgi:hypothetical protein